MERTEQQLRRLWKQVFSGCDSFWDVFFRCAYSLDHCQFIAEDGDIQAALYWFDLECGGPWAYIFAVATRPENRGKGLCRKLMEKTHAHLKAQGYAGALLVPAEPELRQMYGKMGYVEGPAIEEFSVSAGPEPLPLKAFSGEHYALARKAYLPDRSVLPQGRTFSLLEESGVRFFAGTGCLLAVEGKLVLEFLGDGNQAPGVLNALGWEQAIFRTPGGTTPFAMGIPLKDHAIMPQYFAFAFD